MTRSPFRAWCATKEGTEAVSRAASGIRFSIFGRTRSARGNLWRALEAASRTEAFAAAVGAEADHFMQVLADASYADALPRATVAARRVVLVPRAIAIGRAQAGAFGRLHQDHALAALDDDLRSFVIRQIVTEMDAALRAASPMPRRPVQGRDGWACVGSRVGTVWMDSLWAGPDGTGHVFMYELPKQGVSRRDAVALTAAMEQMTGAVTTLSRTARDAMLRAATLRRV